MANQDIKDFFNKDFARTTTSTLIGALTAFLAYFFYKRWESQKEGEKASLKESRRLDYLSSLVSRSFEQVKVTTKAIQQAVEAIEQSPLHLYEFRLPANNALNRLQEVLEKEEYHDAYLNIMGDAEAQRYNQLVSTTEFLLNQRERLHELNQMALTEDGRRKATYISMVYDLLKRGMDLVQRPGLLEDEEIVVINRIYDTYYASFSDYSDLDYHQEYFISPMLDNALSQYTDRMPVLELATGFKTARNLFEDIKARNKAYRSELLTLISTYQSNELLFEAGLQDLLDRKAAVSDTANSKSKDQQPKKGRRSDKVKEEKAA